MPGESELHLFLMAFRPLPPAGKKVQQCAVAKRPQGFHEIISQGLRTWFLLCGDFESCD